MKKKVRYIEEIYTDIYKTLYQAILIDTRLVNEDIFDEVNDILQKYKAIIGSGINE